MENGAETYRPWKAYAIIVLLWLFFQVIWYLKFGFHFDLEAGKYIDEATYLLQHHQFSESRYLFYFTTTAVIAFCLETGFGLYGAIILIAVINLFSYLYFFKALQSLFSDRLSPFLVAGFLMYFWPYQSWSLFLFTECLFYSMVLLLFSHLILFKRLHWKFLLVLGCLLILVVISRPLGILFILPALLFVFLKLTKRQQIIAGVVGIGFLLLLNAVVQVVFTTTPDWNMKRALTEDSIICDMPRVSSAEGVDLSQRSNQLYQLFYYVVHNFSHFAGLALTRLRYFFTMIRPYFSPMHNFYLVVHLAVLYLSILIGIRRLIRTFPTTLLLFAGASILFFAATVALQCDDYHNRFALTLMPFYTTLAVWAAAPLIRRISFLK